MALPCSPTEEINGFPYFPRLCDKVRLHAKGELPEAYHANLGRGMDLWTCQFFGVLYEELAEQVKAGASDKEALSWAKRHGVKRADHEFEWWKAYMITRGFRDDFSDRLKMRKEEAGMSDRDDILTFMDFIDADEGR